MMDPIQCPIMVPAAEVVIHGAARRQVFRQRRPLATGAQDVHQPVDDLLYVNRSLVAAPLGWRNQRLDEKPLLLSQITGVAQSAAVIPTAVLFRPHPAAPANRPPSLNHK